MSHRLIVLPDEARKRLRSVRLCSAGRSSFSKAQVFQTAIRLFLDLPWNDQEQLVVAHYLKQQPSGGEDSGGPKHGDPGD